MRKITKLIIHCSDSDNPKHDNVKTIRQWHTQRGFTGPDGVPGTEDDVGYHFVIVKNGDIKLGRPIEAIGAHTLGQNKDSLGVCLTGSKVFSKSQFETLEMLCKVLCETHNLSKKDIYPHNHFDKNRTCPNFNLKAMIKAWKWD